MAQSAASPSSLSVCYDGAPPPDAWALVEATVPESTLHDQVVLLLCLLLQAWAERGGRGAYVARNLALRWYQTKPKVGLDPDIALYEPAPPLEGASLPSVRTWVPGHSPPKVAVEVVSEGHPYKDYADAPARYAASGTGELWVFDPLLAGPKAQGGPHRLQVWARGAGGLFERHYAGDGPARSPFVGAWLVPVEGGSKLRLGEDRQGRQFWPTAEEAERAAKERALAAEAAERAAKEAAQAAEARAEAENERLRAEIARLRGGGREG